MLGICYVAPSRRVTWRRGTVRSLPDIDLCMTGLHTQMLSQNRCNRWV